MKKIILILLLVLSGCGPNMSSYQNKKYNFSILLPRNWSRYEDISGVAVLAREETSQPEDKFKENLNVAVSDLPENISHEVFFELNRDKILEILPGTKYNLEDSKLNAEIGKGLCLTFNNKIEDLNLKVITCSWIKQGRVYAVTCVCESGKSHRYEPIFKKALGSLQAK